MTFQAVAALVLFGLTILATVALVLRPVAIQLPAAWHRHLRCSSVGISYAAAPVAGTLLMLATGALDGASFAAGIVGDDRMKPYGIVILFMALAYMSSSLDMTGCFQWVALHLTRLSRGDGLALFLLYYALSSVLTIFTSNDVSIMALTPIIYYFAAATGADPVPFLTAEFTAANIWSMLLFVGNPTNIIVAMAYGLGFLDYSRWMALPTIAAGFAALAAVLGVHWHSIPRRLQLPDLHPEVMLVDKPGALLGAVNILTCLGLLAAAPALKWELWVITLVCAALHALYNFVAYVACRGRWCAARTPPAHSQQGPPTLDQPSAAAVAAAGQQQQHEKGPCVQGAQQRVEDSVVVAPAQLELVLQEHQVRHRPHSQQHQPLQQTPAGAAGAGEHAAAAGPGSSAVLPAPADTDADGSLGDAQQLTAQSRSCSRQQLLTAQQHAACSSAPEVPLHSSSAVRCPGSKGDAQEGSGRYADMHGPAVGQGCCADGSSEGAAAGAGLGLQPPPMPSFWKAVLVLPWEVVPFVLGMFCVVEGLNANGWVDRLAAWLAGGLGGSAWGALFGVGALSLLLANIINNQPMTILMTRVCMSPAFTAPLAAAAAAAGAAAGGAAAVPRASAFAVVVASNTAANFSVMGALAGIMFVNILQQRMRGMKHFTYPTFSKLMLPAGVVSTLLALAVLGAEFATWGV